MKKLIGKTMNGMEIYMIIDDNHMNAHKTVQEEHIAEAICTLETLNPFQIVEIDLHKQVGFTDCVETTEEDVVFFTPREGREVCSRMVAFRDPEPTTKITIGICKDSDDGLYTVFTAFYGEKAPKELFDERLTDEERPEAEAFWANHALIYRKNPPMVKGDEMLKYIKENKSIIERWGLGGEWSNAYLTCMWETTWHHAEDFSHFLVLVIDDKPKMITPWDEFDKIEELVKKEVDLYFEYEGYTIYPKD